MLRRECEEEQRSHEAHEATQIQSLGPSHWGPGEMQCPLVDEDPEGKGDPKGRKDPKGKGIPKGKTPKGKGRSESSARAEENVLVGIWTEAPRASTEEEREILFATAVSAWEARQQVLQ